MPEADEKPHFRSQTSNDSIKAKLACLVILARDMSNRLTFWPNRAATSGLQRRVRLLTYCRLRSLFKRAAHQLRSPTSPLGTNRNTHVFMGILLAFAMRTVGEILDALWCLARQKHGSRSQCPVTAFLLFASWEDFR